MFLKQVTSYILALLLVLNPLCAYLPVSSGICFATDASSDAIEDALSVVPIQYGSLISQRGYDLNRGSGELIVIVDAHDNLSAQYNISKMLDYLSAVKDLHAVYLEGACGLLDTDKYFGVFNDKEINGSVSDVLLKKGFITGAEYFYLNALKKVPLKGAEVASDYEANLVYLRRLKTSSLQDTIGFLLDQFNLLVRENQAPWLIEVDKLYSEVVLEGKDISAFLVSLTRKFSFDIGMERDAYPVLSSMSYMLNNASKMNFFIIKRLSELSDKVVDNPDLKREISVVKKKVFLEGDKISSVEEAYKILSRYTNLTGSKSVKAIKEYYDAMKQISSISSSDLYIDILDSYRRLALENGIDKEMFEGRDKLFGLFKGSMIRLTPKEFTYLGLDKIDVTSYLSLLLKNENADKDFVKKMLTDKILERIELAKRNICDFYNSVERRNASIVSTVIADLPKDKTGVVIVGGYHKGICEDFARHNIKVSLVMPKLKMDSASSRDVGYSEYLSGRFSSLERMIYYAWSTIISRILSQPLSLLENRKDAIPPIVARQIAIMTGAVLTIHDKSLLGDISQINETLENVLSETQNVNDAITAQFKELLGSESVPRWPEVIGFELFDNNLGVLVTFKIGSRTFHVGLLKEGASLSPSDERKASVLEMGYVVQDRLVYRGENYSLKFVHNADDESDKKQSILAKYFLSPLKADNSFLDIQYETVPWEKGNFFKTLIYSFEVESSKFHKKLSRNIEVLEEHLGYDGYLADGGFAYFNDIFSELSKKLRDLDELPHDYIVLNNVPGSKPVRIYLVGLDSLRARGVHSLSIPRSDRLDLYLPVDYINLTRPDLIMFIQLLKFELDAYFFSSNGIISALYERVFEYNFKDKPQFGEISDRISDIFKCHFDRLKSHKEIYYKDRKDFSKDRALYDSLSLIIELQPEALDVVKSDKYLTEEEKKYTVKLIKNIVHEANFYKKRIVLHVAEGEGEIFGFRFKRLLGSGGFAKVYLAERVDAQGNVTEWAVKLPYSYGNSRAEDVAESFRNEHKFAQEIHGDVFNEPHDETAFFAVPYSEGQTIADIFDDNFSLLNNPLAIAEMAVNIAAEMGRIHSKGYVLNDFSPQNIFIKFAGLEARVLDLDYLIGEKAIPKTFDDFNMTINLDYISPEMKGFVDGIEFIRDEILFHDSEVLSAVTFERFFRKFTSLFDAVEVYPHDKDKMKYLKENLIPEIEKKRENGEFTEISEIFDILEPYLLELLYSMITPRSDIYSFGASIIVTLFSKSTSLESDLILSKMIAENPLERFSDFREVYDQLKRYKDNILLNRVYFSIQSGSERDPIEMESYFMTPIPITKVVPDTFKSLSESLRNRIPNVEKSVAENFGADYRQKDAGLTDFIKVIDEISEYINSTDVSRFYIELKSLKIDKKVIVHLVSLEKLMEQGVTAVTVEHENRVEIKLPYEYFVNPKKQRMFLQLLKHEIDINIHNVPNTVAVLQERVLDSKYDGKFGDMSERIKKEFINRFESAKVKDSLQEFHDFLSDLISREVSMQDAIEFDPRLNDKQKSCAIKLAENIINDAYYYRQLAISEIARIGGTLNGFRFKKEIGYGGYSKVYLAEKRDSNGELKKWVIKILFASRFFDIPDKTKAVLKQELKMTQMRYGDVYMDGDPSFLAVPYHERLSLNEFGRDLAPADEVKLMIDVVDELIITHDLGIICNDIKGSNIIIKRDGHKPRLIDFGLSNEKGWFPRNVFEADLVGNYISPERTKLAKCMNYFKGCILILSQTGLDAEGFERFKNGINFILDDIKGYPVDPEILNNFVKILIPEISTKFNNGEYSSVQEILEQLEPRFIELIYSIQSFQSDIYSFGKTLDADFSLKSPALSKIIQKATKENAGDRYRDFRELRAELVDYRNDLILTEQLFTKQSSSDKEALNLRSESWERQQFTQINLAEYEENLREKLPKMKKLAEEKLGGDGYDSKTHLDDFMELVSQFVSEVTSLDRPVKSITLHSKKSDKPIHLFLSTISDMLEDGVTAYTRETEESINIYLPYEYFASQIKQDQFFQLLKHELDVNVYRLPNILTVLQEPLVQIHGTNLPGMESARFEEELYQHFFLAKRALTKESSVALHDFYDRLNIMIERHQDVLDIIESDDRLNTNQKIAVKKLVGRVLFHVKKYKRKVQHELMEAGETIDGLKFIRQLGDGWNSIVYLAKKSDLGIITDVIVKMPKYSFALEKEDVLFVQEYNYTKMFLEGTVLYGTESNPDFIVMPYKGRITLDKVLDSSLPSMGNTDKIDMALDVLAKYIEINRHGLLYHDIKPDNVIITDMGDVQIIDYGSTRRIGEVPDECDEAKIMVVPFYMAPEVEIVNKSLPDINLILDIARYNPLTEGNLDKLIIDLNVLNERINSNSDAPVDEKIYADIKSDLLTRLKRRFKNGEIKSFEDILPEIRRKFIRLVYSGFDGRCEVYAFGKMLEGAFFKESLVPDGIGDIIRKATAEKVSDRYDSLQDLFDALKRAKFKLVPDDTFLEFLGVQRTSMGIRFLRAKVAQWKKMRVDASHASGIAYYKNFYTATNTDTLRRQAPTRYLDTSVSHFIGPILDNIAKSAGKSVGKRYFDFNVPGRPMLIRAHFVSKNDLNSLSVSALTIPAEGRLDMYLPSDRIAESENADILLQLIKQQLDIHVYGMHPAEAVFLEYILNGKIKDSVGKLSSRLKDQIQSIRDDAIISNNLTGLYNGHSLLKEYIDNYDNAMTVIEKDTDINDNLKDQIKRTLNDMSRFAMIMRTELECYIAIQGGELRGFKFIKPLGEGGFGSAFLAEKDGELKTVKMVKHSLEKFTNAEMADLKKNKESFDREYSLLDAFYEGKEVSFSGDYRRGENVFQVLPYFEGDTLSEAEYPQDTVSRIDIALAIIDEFKRAERNGVNHNDIRLENILINVSDNKAKLIDFGCASRKDILSSTFEDAVISAHPTYASPEILEIMSKGIKTLVKHLYSIVSSSVDFVEYDYFLKLETIVENLQKYSFDKDIYDEIIDGLLVTVSQDLINSEIQSTKEIINILEPVLVRYIYSILDSRSDMYGVANLLKRTVFKGHLSEDLLVILDKASAHEKSDRYDSFIDLYSALDDYKDQLLRRDGLVESLHDSIGSGSQIAYNNLVGRVKRLGGLEQDIKDIMALPVDQYIRGDFGDTNSIPESMRSQIHDLILDEHLRRSAELVIGHFGLDRVHEAFFESFVDQTGDRDEAVKKITEFRAIFENTVGVEFINEFAFLSDLLTRYLAILFMGKSDFYIENRSLRDMFTVSLDEVISSVESDSNLSLRFNMGATGTLKEQKIQFVQNLLNNLKNIGITDRLFETPSESIRPDDYRIGLDTLDNYRLIEQAM